MQPLNMSIFGPITAACQQLITDFAPYVAAARINKVQFRALYAQACAKVLTSAAARKAFSESGMTVGLIPSKVLSRLAGLSNAACPSGSAQPAAQEHVALPRFKPELSAMLDSYRTTEDPQEARALKQTLLQAYLEPQAEQTATWAETLYCELRWSGTSRYRERMWQSQR